MRGANGPIFLGMKVIFQPADAPRQNQIINSWTLPPSWDMIKLVEGLDAFLHWLPRAPGIGSRGDNLGFSYPVYGRVDEHLVVDVVHIDALR